MQILYRASLLDAEVAAGPESLEVALVGWDQIPWAELAFPTVEWVLRRAGEVRLDSGPLVTSLNPAVHDR